MFALQTAYHNAKTVRKQACPRNVQRFRGGLVFQAHRLCVSLNSRLDSNTEKEEEEGTSPCSSPSY